MTGVAGDGELGVASKVPRRRTFCIRGVSSNVRAAFLVPGVASTWIGVLEAVGSLGGDLGSLKDGRVLSVEGRVGVELPLLLPLLSLLQTESPAVVLVASSDAVISRHNFTWLAPMMVVVDRGMEENTRRIRVEELRERTSGSKPILNTWVFFSPSYL